MPHPTSQVVKNAAARKKRAEEKRTTVLHLIPSLNPDAGSRATVDLALLTHRRGWRPLIASSGGGLVLEAERSAIRHTAMPLNKKSLWAAWRCRAQLEALYHRAHPDLIHAHGVEVLDAASTFAALHRLPFLVEINNPVPVSSRNKKRLQRAIGLGALFVVPSDYMAMHLQKDLGLLSPFLYRIAPGIDLGWYDVGRITPERVQSLATAWRLPEASTVILMAAPLAPGQGHKILLESLAKLKRPDLFVVMIGKGEGHFQSEVEAHIRTLQLEGQAILLDYCTDWPAACWLANLAIAPNPLPRGEAPVLLTAAAMGRPVIATDCGANANFVKSGETAWLLPPDNIEALTAALDEATRLTPDQRLELAERTRAFVAEHFTQEAWAGATFKLYESMVSGKITV